MERASRAADLGEKPRPAWDRPAGRRAGRRRPSRGSRARSDALARAGDGRPRCFWAVGGAPEYLAYHDDEWGRPVLDDDRLFERLSLEAFQSGLSWLTILRKRDNFRAAFAGFHIPAVAAFGADDVERLLADAGIVRNRQKIEAAVANAQAAAALAGATARWPRSAGRFARPPTRPRGRGPTSSPRPPSRPRWPRRSSSAAFASSVPRRPTRSCRPPAS